MDVVEATQPLPFSWNLGGCVFDHSDLYQFPHIPGLLHKIDFLLLQPESVLLSIEFDGVVDVGSIDNEQDY